MVFNTGYLGGRGGGEDLGHTIGVQHPAEHRVCVQHCQCERVSVASPGGELLPGITGGNWGAAGKGVSGGKQLLGSSLGVSRHSAALSPAGSSVCVMVSVHRQGSVDV